MNGQFSRELKESMKMFHSEIQKINDIVTRKEEMNVDEKFYRTNTRGMNDQY